MSDTANQDKFADALQAVMPNQPPTVRLTEETVAALKEIARNRDLSDIGDALLQAIADELVLARAHADGSRVYIEQRDRKVREIVLR